MSSLLRERGTLGHSKSESTGDSLRFSSLSLSTKSSTESLPLPFGELGGNLSDQELRETAYEIFVAACRNTSGKPLTYISSSERAAAAGSATPSSAERSLSSASSMSPSPSLQRSLTSTAASKMKKALGLKSSKKSPGKESSPSRTVKKPMTIGELMRVQMRVSEQADSRIRRGLLRISASQVGVAPMEDKIRENHLRWFGHVNRRPSNDPIRRVDVLEPAFIKKGRGRPKKT